jgi:hypothetical protein
MRGNVIIQCVAMSSKCVVAMARGRTAISYGVIG